MAYVAPTKYIGKASWVKEKEAQRSEEDKKKIAREKEILERIKRQKERPDKSSKEKRKEREEEIEKRKIESKTAPVVKLTPKPKEKTGLAKLREEDTITGKLIRATTDWRTTVALVGTLATIGIGAGVIAWAGAKGAVGATGLITHQVTAKGMTQVAQRAFVGKASHQIPSALNKIFHTVRPVATRFATNKKSYALTTKLLSKTGMSMGAAGILLGAIGSYPFAGFIKEEALQTLGFGFNTAKNINDVEGMELAIEETEEILNAVPGILSKIPYANVLKQLSTFFEAARVKLEIDKRTFEEAKRDIEDKGEFETSFEKSAREREERDIEFKESEKERHERQEERDRAFMEAQEKRDLEDRQDSAYFEVLRQMKSPFPEGTPVEDIDPEIVALAKKSNLYLNQF